MRKRFCHGASVITIFRRIIFRSGPAMLTVIGLAFARSMGEYGSVVFIAGNKPHETSGNCAAADYVGIAGVRSTSATAIALGMVIIAFRCCS